MSFGRPSRPLIGLTAANLPAPDWDGRLLLNRDIQSRLYSEAVALAGGLPVILPAVRAPLDRPENELASGAWSLYANAKTYLERLDGLILTGGGDLAPPPDAPAPELYREVDRTRDLWETALLTAALKLAKPVLSICRGLQLLNVALGGTLWADLPSERPGPVNHAQKLPRVRATHSVTLTPGSRLAGILEFREIMVNSGHHQGVKDIAPQLLPAALAADGLVEALERPAGPFVVGVQWHPEGEPASGHSRALMAALVQAAGG
ncbi:MAG: gamma-glutamyl-gamma-aminobutyrate hydrolase family protein [Candidatus Adiutrix sp.]|jgi:putative glutamine amidotransferase|nr:gamma-glutamyl-gamma-aminobutyrate hydrolase family protein [Candidatus Adiutrix sp.]